MLKELFIPRPSTPRPAVFLDRDGTLNVEKNYLFRYEDWEWEEGAAAAIRHFRNQGFLIIVLTNQSGIARRLYDIVALQKLHGLVQLDLARIGAQIDAFYCCPHHPQFTGGCLCRKPGSQMLQEAAKDLNVNMQGSWMIGDRMSDLLAGLNCELNVALVRTGYGRQEEGMLSTLSKPVRAFDTLAVAAEAIVGNLNIAAS